MDMKVKSLLQIYKRPKKIVKIKVRNEEKMIIIINGPCGVGKTTTSKELGNILPHSIVIEADKVTKLQTL